MFFLRGLAVAIFFQSISNTFSTARCPPISDLKGCKCEKSESLHILECNDVDLPDLQHVWVDEIIITKTKSVKVGFGFIPKHDCPTITLQDNENLKDIDVLLTDSVTKIKLINNKQLNSQIDAILMKIKNVEIVHIENSEIKTLNITFDLGNLKNLQLPSNGIQTINSNVFTKLPSLNILDLSHNGINTLNEDSLKFKDILTSNLEIFINDNQINAENLISNSNLHDNTASDKLTVHLENNKINHITADFDIYITKKIKINFDGNDITCDPYADIKNLLKKPDAKKYLLNIFCKDYNNINIFEIQHFINQPTTASTIEAPLPTTPDSSIPKHLKLTIIQGKFDVADKSYVAVCINDETVYDGTVDTDSCVLCGRSDIITKNHTQYGPPCDMGTNKHKESAILVFGAATIKDAKLSPSNVKGLAMITIKEALEKQSKNSNKGFQLPFDDKQFIEVKIDLIP